MNGFNKRPCPAKQLLHLIGVLSVSFNVCRWNNTRGLRFSSAVQRICFTGSKSTDKVIYSSGLTTPLLSYSGATDSPKCFSGAILNHSVGTHAGKKRMSLQVAATLAADLFTVGLRKTQCEGKQTQSTDSDVYYSVWTVCSRIDL